MLIAASHYGWNSRISLHLDHAMEESISLELIKGKNLNQNGLFEYISIRQSTRNDYDGKSISKEDWMKIIDAANGEDVEVLVFKDQKEMNSIIPFVKEGAILQFQNQAFVDELIQWIRFNESKAEKTGDGLSGKVTGNPSVPTWLGKIFMGLSVSPEKEADKYEELILNSSGLMLFIAKRNDKKAWINLGRSFERAVLMATSLGINHAHMNMPCEEEAVRKKLVSYLKLEKNMTPLLLIRLGYSEKMPYSYRRPLEEVLV
ncbi:hypothetical protein [Aquiflexum sp.]|uniref:hypothetical protein n=1 Tax=Aquiflexum sp. TaxID=1872584 RepID=UPI0035942DBF